MSMMHDFKAFITRGNVVDLAVGVIIGAAFGSIVASLVSDIIMPPIGLLLSGLKFEDIVTTLKHADATGKGAVTINWGKFFQTVINFLIVAFCIFYIVRVVARLKRKEADVPPAPPTLQEELLTEIRDLLRQKS